METPETFAERLRSAAPGLLPTRSQIADETRRRDEAHEAEKQALRAERDEANEALDRKDARISQLQEKLAVAQADADALRDLLSDAADWLIGSKAPLLLRERIRAALAGTCTESLRTLLVEARWRLKWTDHNGLRSRIDAALAGKPEVAKAGECTYRNCECPCHITPASDSR